MDQTTELLTQWLKDMPESKVQERAMRQALKTKAGEVSIGKGEIIEFMKRFYWEIENTYDEEIKNIWKKN